MAGIIAVHLGLLNRAAWEPDEYRIISGFRDDGINSFWQRFRAGSPRPLSELLFVLYAWLVVISKQQLIAPVLLALWAVFLASGLPTLAGGGVPASRILGTLAVLAFMVLGHGAFEVFYWPIGAMVYLPVLSAALFLLFSLANEQWRAKPGGVVTALVLLVAAWSAEAGALMVLLCFGAIMTAALLWKNPRIIVLYWGVPVLAALLVLVLVLTDGRLLTATGIENGDPALIHHWAASAVQAAIRGSAEFLSADAETFDLPHILLGLSIKLLFFAGVHLCWITPDPTVQFSRRWLLPLAFGFLATAFVTLVVSYWNHGTTCCQRHNLLRQDLGFLALAAIAIWLPPLIPTTQRWAPALASVLLTAAAILALAPRARDIALDYRFYSEPARARALSWASGFSPGPDMVLYQPVPDSLFSLAIPSGTWRMDDNWWINGVLRFFGKDSLRVILAGSHIKAKARFPQ